MIKYKVKPGSYVSGHSYSEVTNKTSPFTVKITGDMTFSNVDLQSIDTVPSGTFYIFQNLSKGNTYYEINFNDVEVIF